MRQGISPDGGETLPVAEHKEVDHTSCAFSFPDLLDNCLTEKHNTAAYIGQGSNPISFARQFCPAGKRQFIGNAQKLKPESRGCHFPFVKIVTGM
jgi:hypothetical protein